MYDLIVIGAGPAGITAAVYAMRKRMSVLVVTGDIGGQTNWTRNIENYTGFHFISGCDLVKRFREHLQKYSIEVKEGELVTRVEKQGDVIRVTTAKGAYESKSLIIASGMLHRKLGVPGEDEYVGKGVAYCATCDAPLFADQEVAVVGGGNSALDAVLQLVKVARKIHLIDIEPRLRADRIMAEKAKESGKVVIHNRTSVTRVYGDRFVKGITIETDGHAMDLAVDGVMVEVGWIPATGFADMLHKNRRGEIIVNCDSETNVPGIFAAGDVSSVPAKQIIIACGEGAKAAIAAFVYVNELQVSSVESGIGGA